MTELVATRGDALQRYAMLLCGSREQAADLVQDALVKTFGRLRNGFSVESAEAYVRRAILNGHLDGGRRLTRWRKVAPLEYVPDEQPPRDGDDRPARSTCTRSCASSARASAPAWCCATTTTSRSTTSPRRSASARARSSATSATGWPRWRSRWPTTAPPPTGSAPPVPRPGTEPETKGTHPCPAILSCAIGSTRARSPGTDRCGCRAAPRARAPPSAGAAFAGAGSVLAIAAIAVPGRPVQLHRRCTTDTALVGGRRGTPRPRPRPSGDADAGALRRRSSSTASPPRRSTCAPPPWPRSHPPRTAW